MGTLDLATEIVLVFLVLFTPWAFGTTETWSIWTANLGAYVLGLILAAKGLMRRFSAEGGSRERGVDGSLDDPASRAGPGPVGIDRVATRVLVAITIGLLAYVAVSALNARADYDEAAREFRYFETYLAWLPHSYDRGATWAAFWQYLGLACVFWSIRDWLRHGAGTRQAARNPEGPAWADARDQVVIPPRLARLLWILCLNGVLLAMVGILQRADGTSRLLWVVGSQSNKTPDAVFGPWSYRANAAQYFNLLWPVCLVFWLWCQERAGRSHAHRGGRFDGPHLILLPCALLLAACPFLSASRGAAMVAAAMGGCAVVLMAFVSRREIAESARRWTIGTLVAAGIAGVLAGWSVLKERLSNPDSRFSTGLDVGRGEFTLLVRMKWEATPGEAWQPLVSLSGNSRVPFAPYSLAAGRFGVNKLMVVAGGDSTTNSSRVSVDIDPAALDEDGLVLALVRENAMRVFANGTELKTVPGHSGKPPGWTNYIHTRYVFPQDRTITEVALVRYAMTPEELAAASRSPVWENPGDLATPDLARVDMAETLGLWGAPDGVVVEPGTRRNDSETRWLAVRRSEGPGPLALYRQLPDIDPRLKGAMRVTFAIWNPGTRPQRIAALLDGGPYETDEIPARTEGVVSLPCRAPHPGTPQQLVLTLVDDTGLGVEETTAGTQFYVRDLRIQAENLAFEKALDREFRLGDFKDRMSGRGEVYANSRRMLADYRIWGSGAGTFASLYQLYMKPGQDWFAYLHDDWGETRITLGLVGMTFVLLGWLVLGWRSWHGRGVRAPRLLVLLWWLAPLGCLAHARFDFPFQVYSVFFLFVVVTSMLTVVGAGRGRAG